MKKLFVFFILFLFSFTLVGCSSEQCDECPKCEICEEKEECEQCEECQQCPEVPGTEKVNVKLGIDLIDKNLDIFKDKKVGLITNPTGVNSQYKSTIDVLYENPNINLTALFAPEHGIRGNSQAGGSIGNEKDVITGLTVYSLYGSTKKPTAEMLQNVDVLCIDIQDVGARFYTYIYTMAYAMEACKELNKTFVVFDRPNPIGGKVEGFILQPANSSFIGLYPIITRHGMTIGELAQLFNTEYNINCDLKVIAMENYSHDLYMDETTVPWINPSPNMPTLDTAMVYTGTGNFEGMNISEGRGTTKPFEFIGAPFINPYKWADKLNSLGLEGVYFRPMYFTPTFEDYANQLCGGVQVHVTDRDKFNAAKVGVAMVYTVCELYSYSAETQSYLKLVTGTDYLNKRDKTMQEVFDILDRDAATFSVTRAKYLIYK